MFKSRRSIREEENLEEVSKERQVGPRALAPVSEEKNKFALSVLRRVRVKLEGREPDSLRKVNLPWAFQTTFNELLNLIKMLFVELYF